MNKQILDFIRAIEKLKVIERFNKTSNLDRPESDAEHIWHLVMMVYLFAESRDIDKWKAVEIALVHDLVEVYAGDVNFWDEHKKTPDEKRKAEEKAARKLFDLLPEETGSYFYQLWIEYEERKTDEAKFVYVLDKIQPFIQRLVAEDNDWKDRQVDAQKLSDIKPELVKQDPEFSALWDDFVQEAVEKKLVYQE